MSEFLREVDPRRWKDLPEGTPEYLQPVEFYLGVDADKGRDIVVRVVDADRSPARSDLEKLWQAMAQSMVLVLAVRYPWKGGTVVDLVGGRRKLPAGAPKGARPRPLTVQKVPVVEAQKFCQVILKEGSPHAANRLVARWMDERASDMPGLKNDGLFARHALLNYVPDRHDWPPASDEAVRVRDNSGRELVRALGFHIDDSSEPNASLLTIDGSPTASALFLDGAASFDDASAQYGAISPVTHALTVARRHRVRWVVLTRKRSIRLHPVSPDLGVGRRGRTTTYVEINLDMLPEDRSAFLWLLFSSDALSDGGTVDEILAASERFANDLGSRLRERVYNEVVPDLATAFGRQLADSAEDGWLAEAYHRTMVVLFRLLFVAYAEDKGLLPYERNVPYTNASLKTLARELIPYTQGEREFSPDSAVFWRRVVNLWRAVDKGKTDWGIPPYNGGLFSASTPTGAALDGLELSDSDFGPGLARLLVDSDSDGVEGPVDFRSLSVREFGSIYEGLLESELAVAETDLATDKKGVYKPASAKDDVLVPAGAIYFHNASGARKSSGSYFTKPFAVEHLLDHALEPAIADHFSRVLDDLSRGDDAAAARRFFDFRCVDISMGSGHFLVAAVDRLEARFSEFLDEHPIPGVTRELETLREAALNELRHCADDALIENAALLRRQIARRCVYGVDLNPVSVELARLAIWIHTFVPGLPLSFLDHNLVAGNSLTGIGTLEEAAGAVDQNAFVAMSLEDMIGKARPALERLASVTDATVADVKAARAAHEEAKSAIEDAEHLFDLLVLHRACLAGIQLFDADPQTARRLRAEREVAAAVADLNPLHYPIAFPEVFLRDRPGFDCILGNPPWEKLHVEEHQWWGLRLPGVRGLAVGKMNKEIERAKAERPDLAAEYERDIAAAVAIRSVLMSGPYPDLGASHPDLYKAFCWRFWQLMSLHGTTGVVLPRAALSGSGMETWRRHLLGNADFIEITTATNKNGWVFDDVAGNYTIAFVSIRRTDTPDDIVWTRGPFSSLDDFRLGQTRSAVELPASGVLTWTEGAAIPLIPEKRAAEVFLKLRESPRLDDEAHPFRFKGVQGDLNSTTGKKFMVLDSDDTRGLWPVFGGSSINLWNPDTGERYAWSEPSVVGPVLTERQENSLKRSGSAFAHENSESLPIAFTVPRIVWRRVARATDSRTVIATVVPANVVLQDTAPFFVRSRGTVADEAYLLGVLSSVALDWYARRVVELHMNFHVVNALPVPLCPDEQSPLSKRVVEIVSILMCPHQSLEHWCRAVAGGSVRPPEGEDQVHDLVNELDALICLLYKIDEEDVRTVFATHGGPGIGERVDGVLECFTRWNGAS